MLGKTEYEAAIARSAHSAAEEIAIRRQLDNVLASHLFKGSRRAQDFLKFVVEKSLAGQFDELKERILGIELFGRPVTYDTSVDAIVRVTANDIRKRLAQYYEKFAPSAEFRIDLPAGSYVPEFTRLPPSPANSLATSETTEVVGLSALGTTYASLQKPHKWIHAPIYVLAFLATVCSSMLALRIHGTSSPRLTLPWSAIFRENRQPQLVFCDASIQILQDVLKTSISLSDYATRKFAPTPLLLRPEVRRIADVFAGPDFTAMAAPVDLRVSARISELATSGAYQLRPRSARELQFRDFKTDADFILLGSPRSNPWTALFQDQLDFNFVIGPDGQHEVCRNAHPKPGELPVYVPTAVGGATGQAYAIAAFIQNPDQSGSIIILAGSNAEGTEAAAKFMTDAKSLAKTLRMQGIDPNGGPVHFEALLRVATLAGSPNHFQVIALHRLA